MANNVASIWLLASEPDEAVLSTELVALAELHATPVFQPHLTILGDLYASQEALDAVMAALGAATAPFTANVQDIVTGDAFYRSFYALFEQEPPLMALRTTALAAFPEKAAPFMPHDKAQPFMPHVSLLYGSVEPAEKEQSRQATAGRLAGRPIRFDRIALTNSADNVPIADWCCLQILPLAGPPSG